MIRLVLPAALLLSAPALAQPADVPPPAPPTGLVSGGVGTVPEYAGSSDYRLIPFGAARFEIAGVTVQTEGPGVTAALIREGRLTAGPFVRWYGGRDPGDISDAAVAALPSVDGSAVAGGYVRYAVARGLISQVDSLSLSGRLGADLLGNVDGLVWSAGVDYGAALSATSFIALSVSATGFSDDYADQHFSIDPAGAAASGLSLYEASGGLRDVGVVAIYDHGIGRGEWSVTVAAGYSRMVGDYADSPIVADRGSADQFFAGVGLGRRF